MDGDHVDDLQGAVRVKEDGFTKGTVVVVRGVRLGDGVDATRAVGPGTGDALVIDVLTCTDQSEAVGVRVAHRSGPVPDLEHRRSPIAGVVGASLFHGECRVDQQVVGGEVVHVRCVAVRVPVAGGVGPQRFEEVPRRCGVVVGKGCKANALLRRDAFGP